ncbi:hypothetical protein J3D56_003927 [Erwinia persicina]|uniref:hypothetical protein n=1 Tax=Erwinia persicina TaxID=55211 RepID=UPI00209F5D70|nr:hypothetical protein [Erwinia persicina]MCP1440491.1 hypothetical protein [Erwinia persicina]
MDNYALINNYGVVENIIVWDGESKWNPPDNSIVARIDNGVFVDIGYTYQKGAFAPPKENNQ